jgi:hypothetical protein
LSEAEQYWMRLRLEGGRLSKARRGELYFHPPAGYVWDANTSRFRVDPDESVQRAIRLGFERFRLDGSAYAVTRYFARQGLRFPVRLVPAREVSWIVPREASVLHMLHNPIYAGAYAFGRSEERMGLAGGELRQRLLRTLAQPDWKVCRPDQHPGYITWDEFMANQHKLDDNRTSRPGGDRHGAAREGHALLQGLALCGRCGRRMSTHYRGRHRRGQYQCRQQALAAEVCFMVSAEAIDEAVEELFLAAVQPPEIELALAVTREAERQGEEVDRQWQLRLERARYEARLAERRYKAVDPDNRVVAGTLEREWEEKLREVEEVEREHQVVLEREKVVLTDEDRAQVLALARDLPAVWRATTTTEAERKNLLRMLVREVTLSPIDVPAPMTRVQVLWHTGAVSDLTVPRRRRGEGRITAPEAHAAIRQLLAEGNTDGEIASELNRRGLRTGARGEWDEAAIQRLRYYHGMHRVSETSQRMPERREDGLYSVHGVAARLGVKPGTVRYWIRNGWLKAVEGKGTGHSQWFRLDEEDLRGLQEAKRRRDTRRGHEDAEA